VDEKNHPDLFWALRGGGGNFGVVTRFKYRLQEVDQIVGGMLFAPATVETITKFVALSESAPEELSTIINVMTAPPMPFLPEDVIGKPIVMAFIVCMGDLDAAEKIVAPFKEVATPYADMVRRMRYLEMYPPEEGEYHPIAASRSLFMDKFDAATAELILQRITEPKGAQMAVTQVRVLGGAMTRVAADATAYAHRDRPIMANVAALFATVEDAAANGPWADKLTAELSGGKPGVYVNFLGSEGEARVREAYPGKTWDRLAAVKKQYDPDNLFRLNQNITPKS
jgi:FAD/FMN-containing dehydrogenase